MDQAFGTMRLFFARLLPELVVDNIIGAVLVIICGSIAVRYLMKIARRGIARLPLNLTIQGFLIACIRLVLYFVVVLLACGMLGIPISSLLALFGMAGLAVSLSVQNLLSNVVSGLVLLISKPFSVGDFIESGSISGTVNSITLLHTHITTPSNKAVFVPNGQLTASEIINHNCFPTRNVELVFSVPASAKREAVSRVVIDAAHSIASVLPEPAPSVNVRAMTPLATEYILYAWSDTPNYWDVHYALLDAIKDGLEKAGLG